MENITKVQRLAREMGFFVADEDGSGDYVSATKDFTLLVKKQKFEKVRYMLFFTQMVRAPNRYWLKVVNQYGAISFELYGDKSKLADVAKLVDAVKEKFPEIATIVRHKGYISKKENVDEVDCAD